MTNCLTTEQLRSLLDETLPAEQQAELQAHVDSCEACQKSLENLVAGTESWSAAVEHLRDDSSVSSEPELAEAVRRIKADDFSDLNANNTSRPLDFLEPSDQPGSLGRLGIYEVSEVIGQGGMGVVVKAFDPALHRVVAVKVLAPYLANNPQARRRFVREAQAIAAVSHDHVITIHAIDESVEHPKIVMQYIAGRSLQEKLDTEGSLELKEILRIGMQTAAGLAAAHAQGLVHRDVKPSNILLENGIQRVKLTDFGLARAVDDASLTQSGVIAGTPQYMAPEQANGDAVDHRADLFSLGSVMYAMCVGHSPFRASTTMGVLKRVCHDPPRPIQELNPDIPDWLCQIIMKLLAKSPADRFSSARQVAELLERWLAYVQQPNVVAMPPSPGPGGSSRPRAERAEPVAEPVSSPMTANDSQTIFFQPVSGRTFLFVTLASIAGCMAFGAANSVPRAELLLVSVVGGLVLSIWLMLLVALFRFLRANLAPIVHWARGTTPASKLTSGYKPAPYPLRAENAALLAAILTLLVSGHLLLGAIAAIIVWRVAKSLAAAPSTTSNPSVEPPASNGRDQAAVTTRIGSWSNVPANLLQQIGSSLGGIFELEPSERNRLLFVIGWCLAGAIDIASISGLLYRPIRTTSTMLFMTGSAFGLLSFAAGSFIYVRQNFEQLRGACFVGLLPLSPGAILRIPISIATLFWLHRPEVRDSFSPIPWQESQLGKLLREQHNRFRNVMVNAAWLGVWTAICIASLILFVIGYVIPSGPSVYHIYDNSVEAVTNKERDLAFYIRGSGSGTGAGIRPSRLVYCCDQIELISSTNTLPLKIHLTVPASVVIDGRRRELFQGDLEGFFKEMTGARHSEEAASLFDSIQRIRPAQGSVTPANPFSLTPVQQHRERNRSFQAGQESVYPVEMARSLFDASSEVLPESVEYAELATLLDPSVFDVRKSGNRSIYLSLNPADWMMVPLGLMSLVIWVTGAWLIARWRRVVRSHRQDQSPIRDGATSLQAAPMNS